jgi:hypothetical protein
MRVGSVVMCVVTFGLAQGAAEAQTASEQRAQSAEKSAAIQELSQQNVLAAPFGGQYCITGNGTRTHDLGLVRAGSNVQGRFESNFDPTAAAVLARVGSDSSSPGTAVAPRADMVWWSSDDGRAIDGALPLQPLLSFVTPHEGSLMIVVGQFSATISPLAPVLVPKCYNMQITVTQPPVTN